MKKTLLTAVIAATILSGCATVPMESAELTNKVKEFKQPSQEAAGIYVYRKDTHFGAALKKDVWIDEECVGETAKGIFFYKEVEGNKEHTLSTESEFSPNDVVIKTERGELYFVEQYIKMGAFVGGAGLKQADTETGKKEVLKLKLAKQGKCSAKKS